MWFVSAAKAIIVSASIICATSSVEPDVQAWDYVDPIDGAELQGFYSIPEGDGPFPALIILP